ncbi:hypothetical protein AA0111_g1096 [Alternaria arborescens]|uniref:hypothetical protein n=1 Tax=Alternaria arborescens TaxID=156630 RepID=UPI001075366F|nr:hypothetical protein AA0111_g1096 [Alternaria arborescens]RYO41176.1 hypothetical protein AA0111_g1096 [Alternaria arborescens]
MKFSTFATLISLSVVFAAVLDTRQECSQNDCYRAVWRDGGLPRTIQAGQDCKDFLTTSVIWNPITTLTVITRTTSTTTTPCLPTLTPTATSLIALPTSSEENKLWIRQVQPTDWSTTTVFGSQPSYATQDCNPQAYSSACECANITTAIVTYLGTVSRLLN